MQESSVWTTYSLKGEKGSHCHSSTTFGGKTSNLDQHCQSVLAFSYISKPCQGALWEKWEEHYPLASVVTLSWLLRRQWLLSLYKALRWKVLAVLCGGGRSVLGIPLETGEVMGKSCRVLYMVGTFIVREDIRNYSITTQIQIVNRWVLALSRVVVLYCDHTQGWFCHPWPMEALWHISVF